MLHMNRLLLTFQRGFRGGRMMEVASKINHIDKITLKRDDDAQIINSYTKSNVPVKMENPFTKEKRQCILCKLEITPNYKNIRLLSQFVSKFTGKIYGRHITGLCKAKHKKVESEINKARNAGLMAYYYRDPNFAHDPKLFDPDNPFRPHSYM